MIVPRALEILVQIEDCYFQKHNNWSPTNKIVKIITCAVGKI